ncbi:hypothetical protein QBC32DRAFT_333566 [Pseudoneurospora amorphoporcata]|uniref:Secreted protein n=1 Tax=Pseudoneurospora amorphoporcata TaxID=241081 RepID=A0AAN6SJC9_9PEZI|nr:hypothetical protein QBC32DRAFT_333566 [Pseudoneurospora amorphoporcata]
MFHLRPSAHWICIFFISLSCCASHLSLCLFAASQMSWTPKPTHHPGELGRHSSASVPLAVLLIPESDLLV